MHCGHDRTKKDPARRYWHNLKQSAKRRRIVFDLPLEDWRRWAAEVRFFEGRADVQTRGDRLSVDRIDAGGPYAIGNIRAIPMRENSRAQHSKGVVYVRGIRYNATVEAHTTEATTEDELEEVLARL